MVVPGKRRSNEGIGSDLYLERAMIFSIQRDLEDYFSRRGFRDPDQYAVALARLYDRQRQGKTADAFLSLMKKIRTAFFRANEGVKRMAFERTVLHRLDDKFKKKSPVCPRGRRQKSPSIRQSPHKNPSSDDS